MPFPVEPVGTESAPIGVFGNVVRGPAGANFQPDATGLLATRGAYDAELAPFSFLATDTADLYFRETATAGVWSAAVPFGGAGGGGTGDVVGPASSVDGRVALFDGATGKLLKQGAAAPMLVGDAPTAHAASHGTAGSDAITVAEGQVAGLTAALAGKETAGAAAAAVAAHEGAADPHPGYLTQTEGDGRYRQTATALSDGDIPAGIARDSEVTAAIGAHEGAADPHPGYLTPAEGDAAYAALAHVGSGGGAHANAVAAGAAGFITGADQTKLDGVASGATANAADAALRDRATHTGTQAVGTITGLAAVATSGAYSDLSGTPSLGTAASADTGTGAGNVVVLNGSSQLPAVDGSLLTNLPSGASDLDGLTDVVITTPATDQVLKYNGTNWINGTTGGGGDALTSGTLAQFASTTSDQLRGVISNETGTGALVFADSPALSGATVLVDAAVTAGTNAQGQAPLTADVNAVTTASANPSGVTLPAATIGRRVTVINRGANTVNVYPASGASIEGLAANAPLTVGINQRTDFNATSATQWYSTLQDSTNVAALFGAGSGMIAFLQTPSSANLRATLTDETGTGLAYFQGGNAGTPSAIVLTNATGLPAAGVTGLGSLATLSVLGSISSAGAIGSTANLPIITGASGVLGVGSFGTAANTFCQGNDSRLSDARTPTSHNQAWSTITSTPTTLSGYGISDAQPSDSDLTSIAALTTTSFGRSFLDRADADAGRTHLGLGTLATQSGTFSGTSSGTNTGDQAITNTSDATSHTLTLSASGGTLQVVEGANVTLTTTGTSSDGVVTIAATGGGGYTDDNYAIPANVLIPQATGPALATITTSTNGIKIGVADFDGVAVEVANFTDARPKNWDGTNPTAKFLWQPAASGSGAATWGIAITAINEDNVVDVAPTWTEVNDAVVTAERDQLTAATAAIAIQGTVTADSRLQFWVRRDPGDGGDTMAQDARLVSVILTFALT